MDFLNCRISTEENEDEVTENEENLGSASTSASTEESIELSPARARPQRVNRAQTRYVNSGQTCWNRCKNVLILPAIGTAWGVEWICQNVGIKRDRTALDFVVKRF